MQKRLSKQRSGVAFDVLAYEAHPFFPRSTRNGGVVLPLKVQEQIAAGHVGEPAFLQATPVNEIPMRAGRPELH
jgi:hypothetical protein